MEGRHQVSMLRHRAESALKTLAEGRRRLAHGQEAVTQLLEDLDALKDSGLDLNLREVQESILEHTAMYAKNPEVLGSMIHLVFGLDLMSQWLTARDQELDTNVQHLHVLQEELLKHRRQLEDLTSELHQLKLEAVTGSTSRARPSSASAVKDFSTKELEELRRENQELRQQLRERPKSGSGSYTGSWRFGADWSQIGTGMVQCLEQLEPMLATMPNDAGFLDLQEEACEAYYELRRILLQAVALASKAG